MGAHVGILGLGVYLPPEVRRNDWWSPDVVERWMSARSTGPKPPPFDELSEGARRVIRAMSEQALDPFRDAVARHVLPSGMTVLDMEEQAALAALAQAGVAPSSIDLLLTYTVAPDHLVANPACPLHHRLGLPKSCFSLQADASSYAFMAQLTLADAMIRAGRARCALLVQSCIPSRLLDMTDSIAPNFGDAATAVVVGPVGSGRGLEASVTFTDGRYPHSLIASVPGRTWYAEGRVVLHEGDAGQAQRMFLGTVDAFKESVDAALESSAHTHGEIDFFCVHQGAPWLRNVVQQYLGLSGARSVETFAQTGYVFASTVPVALAHAQEQRVLGDGDLVVLAAGGPGATYGAAVVRWGA
jgi:3-oxoacyl-[acyl-carrier-protein] synthase-3